MWTLLEQMAFRGLIVHIWERWPGMLNLNDLSLFVHAVDHKGIAPAARHLHMPKSTLSKRLAELEKSLGVRLVHRTSRSFVLTEVGRTSIGMPLRC